MPDDWPRYGDETIDNLWYKFALRHREMNEGLFSALIKPSGRSMALLHVKWHCPTSQTSRPYLGVTADPTNACARFAFTKLGLELNRGQGLQTLRRARDVQATGRALKKADVEKNLGVVIPDSELDGLPNLKRARDVQATRRALGKADVDKNLASRVVVSDLDSEMEGLPTTAANAQSKKQRSVMPVAQKNTNGLLHITSGSRNEDLNVLRRQCPLCEIEVEPDTDPGCINVRTCVLGNRTVAYYLRRAYVPMSVPAASRKEDYLCNCTAIEFIHRLLEYLPIEGTGVTGRRKAGLKTILTTRRFPDPEAGTFCWCDRESVLSVWRWGHVEVNGSVHVRDYVERKQKTLTNSSSLEAE